MGALCLCASPLPATHAWAAAGDLDPSFSGNGRIVFGFPHSHGANFGNAVTSLPNNKLLVVGGTGRDGTDFGVARLDPNGELDRAFSHDGRVAIHYPYGPLSEAAATAVSRQRDGKIVVVGYLTAAFGRSYLGVVRLNRDGTFDRTFSSNGRCRIARRRRQSSLREPVSVAIERGGKLVVSAARNQTAQAPGGFMVARLNPSGSLDRTFSDNGRALVASGSHNPTGGALALEPDGRIVLAGATAARNHSEFLVARLRANGSPDRGFSGNGRAKIRFGTPNAYADSVAIEYQGKIVAAGASFGPHRKRGRLAVARFNPNGDLDPTFSGDGRQTTAIGYSSFATGIGIQHDGKIVAAGTSEAPHNGASTFALARFRAHGALDRGFGHRGHRRTRVGSTGALGGADGRGMVIQRSGKIVVVGDANPRRYEVEFALARYLAK